MLQCPNCGHQNRAGIVFCENCGASLIGKTPIDTKSLDSSSEDAKSQIGIDASVLTDVKIQGTSTFNETTSLRLRIEGSPEPIIFKPQPETIFGRRDPATGAMPDIDLTPFAGYRMGVSRRHAAIRHGEDDTLDIWDLGSSNGTFLNGQRLSAHRPYRLHDGDELRLGQMVIRIYFQAESQPQPPAEEKAPDQAEPQPEPQPTTHSLTEEANKILGAEPEAPPESAPKPEPAKPAASQPEASQPETSKPEASQPEPSQPETSKPEPPQPETSKPEASKPEPPKPEPKTAESEKPAEPQPKAPEAQSEKPESSTASPLDTSEPKPQSTGESSPEADSSNNNVPATPPAKDE